MTTMELNSSDDDSHSENKKRKATTYPTLWSRNQIHEHNWPLYMV